MAFLNYYMKRSIVDNIIDLHLFGLKNNNYNYRIFFFLTFKIFTGSFHYMMIFSLLYNLTIANEW